MTRFGATPEEWAHFSDTLGLTADLLPVVSRPDAPISPDSKMKGLGKTPSIYNQRRQVAGIPNWTQHKATAASVKRWATEGDYGICMQTRLVRALDIDVSEPGEAEAIADVIEEFGLPCRKRSNSPKRLFVFALPGDMPKRSFRCAGGLVEALMTGQQFICSGTHPTGARYEWADGLPERIPELTLEQFERLWGALVDGFATAAPVGGALRKRDEMIEGLDDPVARWLIDKGLVLGEGRDGALYLTCPWIDEHSSDSGLTETAWFPSGSNGYATGAFKCLHAHCDGRTADDFVKAIGYVEAGFDVVEVEEPGGDGAPVAVDAPKGFVRDKNGRIEATLHNLTVALSAQGWTGTDIAFDSFRAEVVVSPHGKAAWRPLRDSDYTRLRLWLERKAFKPIGRELMRDAILMIAETHEFDSAQLWISGLTWDGVSRVDTFLARYFGAADTPYTRAVSRYWWTAHAGRVVEPGAKCDMMPILVSSQGDGKSEAIAAMMPSRDAAIEINLDHKDDDLSRKMRGALVGEVAELRGLLGRTAEENKAWLSRRAEQWTPKYMEHKTTLPRRLVLVGTTNKDEFLGDETGERRYLPVRVALGGPLDLKKIERDRLQLWAEARVLFAAEGVAWQDAFELAKAEHGAFKVVDIWQSAVTRWLVERGSSPDGSGSAPDWFSLEDVFIGALGLSATKCTEADQRRMGKVLRVLGFKNANRRVFGAQRKVWVAGATACYASEDDRGSTENGSYINDLA
jgi:predicted P-loop ATPase